MNFQISLISYSVAAAAFAILIGLLLTLWRARTRGSLLLVACVVSAGWALVLAFSSTQTEVPISRVLLAEMAHDSAWLIFLSSLLGGAVAVESNWLVRRGGVVLGLGLVAAGLLLEFTEFKQVFPSAVGQTLVMGSIATSLYALVGIEQLYRNARPTQQNGLKFLCLGLAGIFGFDLFLYTNAVVDGQIQPMLWGARGFVVALCIPLIAISVWRISSWKRGIFASRQIVFYTTTLFAAGIYLSLIGVVGYFIQTLGTDWGDAFQLVFFSAAVLAFFALLMSEQLRARIRVFVTKHFFEGKYDYRAEWLQLIQTLTTTEDNLPLKKRAIKALAQIVNSPSGHLWLRNEEDSLFVVVAGWDSPSITAELPAGSALPLFLADRGWIIDIVEVLTEPDKYHPLGIQNISVELAATAFIVPLLHEGELLGFVALSKPKTPATLNFEDHDLLKTVGQQIASYLAQAESAERLAENRQFEAYNRFTAFVMHDLKNAIAQQSLVVENAEKHKRNPEFIDDAMETIRGSVTRMRRVMAHLRQSAVDFPSQNVDVNKLLLQVESECSDREPRPTATVSSDSMVVKANRERLLSAVSHAVRNAQDASDENDNVSMTIRRDGEECLIEISDTGCGMDSAFIRERLFRPFDSTKGADGMGIGAYQIRESMRAGGGDVQVKSEVGVGTTLILTVPLVDGGIR